MGDPIEAVDVLRDGKLTDTPALGHPPIIGDPIDGWWRSAGLVFPQVNVVVDPPTIVPRSGCNEVGPRCSSATTIGGLTRSPTIDIFTLVQISTNEKLSAEEAIDLAELFRLLGDPTRVRILFALLEADELCVSGIAEAIGASETKVSQALRLFRGAGVVRNRRDGRNVHYHLDDDHVQMLLEVSRTHLSHLRGDQ